MLKLHSLWHHLQPSHAIADAALEDVHLVIRPLLNGNDVRSCERGLAQLHHESYLQSAEDYLAQAATSVGLNLNHASQQWRALHWLRAARENVTSWTEVALAEWRRWSRPRAQQRLTEAVEVQALAFQISAANSAVPEVDHERIEPWTFESAPSAAPECANVDARISACGLHGWTPAEYSHFSALRTRSVSWLLGQPPSLKFAAD
jgi:hypothetical protein